MADCEIVEALYQIVSALKFDGKEELEEEVESLKERIRSLEEEVKLLRTKTDPDPDPFPNIY
jgi:cell division protein FtsB